MDKQMHPSSQTSLLKYNNMIYHPERNKYIKAEALEKGFGMAYYTLIKAIADNDLRVFNEICEQKLADQFIRQFRDVNYKYKDVRLLNAERITPENIGDYFDFEVIDYWKTQGANISREVNEMNNLYRIEGLSKEKSTMWYRPDGTFEKGDPYTLNLALLLKVETVVKLDLVDFNGKSIHERVGWNKEYVTAKQLLSPEVHYMRMECVINRTTFDLWNGFRMWYDDWMGTKFDFEEWTITDFDNSLLGNPLVQHRVEVDDYLSSDDEDDNDNSGRGRNRK